MTRPSNGVKLYPTSTRDRVLVWGGIASALTVVFALLIAVTRDDAVGYYIAAINGFAAVFAFVMAYAF